MNIIKKGILFEDKKEKDSMNERKERKIIKYKIKQVIECMISPFLERHLKIITTIRGIRDEIAYKIKGISYPVVILPT